MSLLDKTISRSIPLMPKAIIKKVSNRYIAGESIAHMVERTRKINSEGFCATIDVLGEVIGNLEQAAGNADEYIKVLEAIQRGGLDANISVKPSAMGLLIDEESCFGTMKRIVQAAAACGNFVRIDMEDVNCTQKEIDLLLKLRADHDNVGIVLQAYLKRTYADMERLSRNGENLRICKGIYAEDPHHLVQNARADRSAINSHFLHHVKHALQSGTYVGIATHDEGLIRQIEAHIAENGIDRRKYEFQMLLGVCEDLRDRLKAAGHKIRIYVPYGKDWYGYSMRRLNENPRIAGYIAKAVLFE